MKSHHIKISLLLFIAAMLTILLGQVTKAEEAVTTAKNSLLAASLSSSSTFDMYIDNEAYVADNIYEFDVILRSTTPATSINVFTTQLGLNYNPSWLAGGTITPTIESYSGNGRPGKISDRGSNILVTALSGGSRNNPVFTITPQARALYRIRMTNSTPFGCTLPDFKFTYGFGRGQVKSMKTLVYSYLPDSSRNVNLTANGLFNGTRHIDGPQNLSGVSPFVGNTLPQTCEKSDTKEE